MKKLFFSAIFLVAVSSVSMANTIADDKTIESKEDMTVLLTDCCIIYDLAYNLAIKEGASPSTADAAANIAYTNCEKSKKTISAN